MSTSITIMGIQGYPILHYHFVLWYIARAQVEALQ